MKLQETKQMMAMEAKQNRIASLDLIRALAAFFVVLHHTVEFICHFQLLSKNDLGTFELSAGFFLFTIAKTGVPFFLMLTGFLLLSSIRS